MTVPSMPTSVTVDAHWADTVRGMAAIYLAMPNGLKLVFIEPSLLITKRVLCYSYFRAVVEINEDGDIRLSMCHSSSADRPAGFPPATLLQEGSELKLAPL